MRDRLRASGAESLNVWLPGPVWRRARELYPTATKAEMVERAFESLCMDPLDALDEQRIRTLMRIHGLREQGFSWSAIAARFNEAGVPTLTGRGFWHKGTVHKLAKE
jgi:hypothetical protein